MNSATWKTWREALGLTAQQVADELGINLRTAQRWEVANDPPSFAVTWLDGYRRQVAERIAAILDDPARPVVLARFRSAAYAAAAEEPLPVAVHSAMMGLACVALAERGIDHLVEWVD